MAGVTERLQEGVEDTEKVVGLHSGVVFPKVPHRPGKLRRDSKGEVAKTSRLHPLLQTSRPRLLESQATPLATPLATPRVLNLHKAAKIEIFRKNLSPDRTVKPFIWTQTKFCFNLNLENVKLTTIQ